MNNQTSRFIKIKPNLVDLYFGNPDGCKSYSTIGKVQIKENANLVHLIDHQMIRAFDQNGDQHGNTIHLEKDGEFLFALNRVVVSYSDNVIFYHLDGAQIKEIQKGPYAGLCATRNHILVFDNRDLQFYDQDGANQGMWIDYGERPTVEVTKDFIFVISPDSLFIYSLKGEHITSLDVADEIKVVQSGNWFVVKENHMINVFDQDGDQHGESVKYSNHDKLIFLS